VIGLDYPELWEWEEFDPSRLLEVMHGFAAPWWVAGGWALDLWLGRETRTHQDVDLAILRGDQHELYDTLRHWELYYATTDHRLVPLGSAQWLEPPLHGIWARPAPDAPWLCEFLLNEHEGTEWLYRGNPAVRRALTEMGSVISEGIPILAPEIVLLHKAHEGGEKDKADFRMALPHLSPSAKAWLVRALEETMSEHPWTVQLGG
jgi:hypothetical protein